MSADKVDVVTEKDDAAKNLAPKVGLQPDGSVVADDDDFCFTFMQSIRWNKPISRTVYQSPWIEPAELENSISMKFMSFKFEPNYIDPDNPLQQGNLIKDLRENERRVKNRKIKTVTIDHVTGGVEEILAVNEDESSSEDSDDFLDEYGNVREPSDSSDQVESSENTMGGTPRKGAKPKKKKQKKKKGKPENLNTSKDSVSGNPAQQQNTRARQGFCNPNQLFNSDDPKFSVLSFKEQITLKQLMKKFQSLDGNMTAEMRRDYNVFQSYQDLIRMEQKEFLTYARRIYELRDGKQFLWQIPSEMKRFSDECYAWKLKRISRFPRLYQPVEKISSGSMLRIIPFCNEQSCRAQFEMRFETNLLEMGQIPKLFMPRHQLIQNGTTLIPFSYLRMIDHFPIQDSNENPKENFAKLGVSFDENAEKLAGIYYPDVVISVSAMKVLFNNFMPQLEEIWTIPITVRQHGATMVIYVDKPLPPTSMTTEEKTNFRCKRGTRFVLQIPWCNQGSGRKRAPGQKRSNTRAREHLPAPAEPEQVSGGFFEDSVDLSVLETFGTSVANTLQQVDGGCDSSSSDEDKMVIALDEDVDSDVAKRPTIKRSTRSQGVTPISNSAGVTMSENVSNNKFTRGRSASPLVQSPSVLTRRLRCQKVSEETDESTDSRTSISRPKASVALRPTRTSARVAAAKICEQKKDVPKPVKPVSRARKRTATDGSKSGADDSKLIPSTPETNVLSVSHSSVGTPDLDEEDNDVLQKKPKQFCKKAIFDSDSEDERTENNVQPKSSTEECLNDLHNSNSADVNNSEKSKCNPNELGSDIQRLIKQSAEYIENRQKVMKCQKVTAVSQLESNKELESTPIPHQSKPLSLVPAQSNPLTYIPTQSKTLSSNLDDLLHRLHSEKHEDYLRRSEKKQQSHQRQKASGNSNLLGDIMTAQTSMFVPKPEFNNMEGKQNFRSYAGEELSSVDAGLNPSDFERPVSGKNVSYRMWNLQEKEGKNAKESLKLLVRSSTHAVYVDKREEAHSFQHYTISHKVEHQPNMGAEIMTRRELANEWISTLLRPGSNLIRLRVDPIEHQVLTFEVKTLKQVTQAGHDVLFKPGETLGNLHSIFSELRAAKLSPGRYLLEHNCKTGAFVRILKNLDTIDKASKPFDLHSMYNATRPDEDRQLTLPPAWLPIDMNVFTRSSIVPGLFQPKPQPRNNKHKGGKNRQHGKRQQHQKHLKSQ